MSSRTSDAKGNVQAICRMEEEALRNRSRGERIGDVIARQAGRLSFIMAHAVWFGSWIVINDVHGIRAFDPYPFPFLTFVVSLEAIFLSLFVLMSQNRASRVADVRSHLDLQINLLAEQESTKTLELLQRLCAFHGLDDSDPELKELQQRTHPEELLRDLQKRLPENS